MVPQIRASYNLDQIPHYRTLIWCAEILEQVKRRVFTKEDQHDGFVPCESTVALTEGTFEVAGELMAMSIAQGGPAPNFLAPWVYNYLTTGLDGIEVQIETMTESNFKNIAKKVKLLVWE